MKSGNVAKLKLLSPVGPTAPVNTAIEKITLVDSEGPEGIEAPSDIRDNDPVQELTDALMTAEEAKEFAQMQRDATAAKPADAWSRLTLSPANICRATQIRGTFRSSGDDADVGERLLEELVAGETAVAMQLQDVEAALASLLSRTVTDPRLAMAVAKVMRETVGLSGAVRRRMENSLASVATLKAQRVLMAAQRGRLGG